VNAVLIYTKWIYLLSETLYANIFSSSLGGRYGKCAFSGESDFVDVL
jgi:hypothetical protein